MIRNAALAAEGHQKIEWVIRHMPLLRQMEADFIKTRPLEGIRLTMSIHLEAKTAYLAKVLASAGAQVAVTGSNPLSTQDAIAAALADDGLAVYAWHQATPKEYTEHLLAALDIGPQLIIDDGGDLVHLLHQERRDLLKNLYGGAEETTTGVLRLRARAAQNKLEFPMMAVNDAFCKHLFDNRYGTGQSVWDAINRTTNLIVAGKTVVVAGYGWCGRGVALRSQGLGAQVVVCEVDPVKALEAAMDGYQVMTMDEAASLGDVFITVTGCRQVIRGRHCASMKDGALLANAGHFDVEIDIPELQALAVEEKEVRANIRGYRLSDGRWINLLAEGRLVNLGAGDGHPAEIMDMSFAIQVLAVLHMLQNRETLKPGVHAIPREIDDRVANMKLAAMGLSIDTLTPEQQAYLSGWESHE
ncbi:adenosylhomocysteinase [Anoxynatronum buryatiense]|nr:adenosylhomocysteinase [Anoxynatronum buryatiense]